MNKGHVVLADRHQRMTEGIRGMLETIFETVVMVADKKSLYKAVDKLKPDLAIVDLSLPVTGEANIAQQLGSRYPELKLIVTSVHDERTVVEEVMASGAAGFVLKQSIADDLLAAVDEVLAGRKYVSPVLDYKIS